MGLHHASVAQNGRLVLPKILHQVFGMVYSDTHAVVVESNKVGLTSIQRNIRRAQALYRQHATKDFSVDDFIAERRAEAARENQA